MDFQSVYAVKNRIFWRPSFSKNWWRSPNLPRTTLEACLATFFVYVLNIFFYLLSIWYSLYHIVSKIDQSEARKSRNDFDWTIFETKIELMILLFNLWNRKLHVRVCSNKYIMSSGIKTWSISRFVFKINSPLLLTFGTAQWILF